MPASLASLHEPCMSHHGPWFWRSMLLLTYVLLAVITRYQTKLLDMQRQGKVAPQVLQQLASEQLLESYIKEQ